MAATLLAIVTAVIMGAVNNMLSAQKRAQQRLASAEIANRLVLMYLDDAETMPSGATPIPYAGDEYRYAMTVTPVEIRAARPDVAIERAAEARGLRLDRIQNIVVQVWLCETSGGALGYDEAVPHARVTRLVDPIGRAMRNPDSADYLLKDPTSARFQEFMNDLQKYSASGGGRRPPGGTPPARPPSGGSKK